MAFLRVDTQTILTIDETVITRSARVSVRYSIDKDERLSTRQRKTWQLSLKEVTSADAGPYMCQLNIEPMDSQVTYLHVTGKIYLIYTLYTYLVCLEIFLVSGVFVLLLLLLTTFCRRIPSLLFLFYLEKLFTMTDEKRDCNVSQRI